MSSGLFQPILYHHSCITSLHSAITGAHFHPSEVPCCQNAAETLISAVWIKNPTGQIWFTGCRLLAPVLIPTSTLAPALTPTPSNASLHLTGP